MKVNEAFVAGLAVAVVSIAAQQSQATLATFGDVVSRAPTAEEITSEPALAGQTVHEFFVTTDSDILSVNQVTIVGALYNNAAGSDTAPPNPLFLPVFPSLGADSWITTPGAGTSIAGTGGLAVPNSTWFDSSTDPPVTNFMFARLTTAEPNWSFVGRVSLSVPGGDPVPFPFEFQGIPEPSTIAMAGMGLIGIVGASYRRRMKKA